MAPVKNDSVKKSTKSKKQSIRKQSDSAENTDRKALELKSRRGEGKSPARLDQSSNRRVANSSQKGNALSVKRKSAGDRDERARPLSVSQRTKICDFRINLSNRIVVDTQQLQKTQSNSKRIVERASEGYTPTKILYDPSKDTFNYLKFLDMHYTQIGPGPKSFHYKEEDALHIIRAATYRFSLESMLLKVDAPAVIVADIHGQYNDLLNIFAVLGRPSERRYVFLGDYVDRGQMSLECTLLLFAYKAKYPDQIYMLRGNHECARTNRNYGFQSECARHNEFDGVKVCKEIQRAFNYLSITALISEKILCVHGGISPHLRTWENITKVKKPLNNPTRGLFSDLLWSDPDLFYSYWRPNTRGSGFFFGKDAVEGFCKRLGVELIVRGHQVCLDGFWTFGGRVVTLFSAPCYTNQFKNAGCVLHVNEKLECELVAFVPDCGPKGAKERIEKTGRVWDPSMEFLEDPDLSAAPQITR